ncbi:MAG: hypothetical protein AABX14_05610 [Candidatus Aenigmatarchaeota archaeon]
MDLNKMQKIKSDFDKERGWNKFDASNVFVHLVEELGEIGRHINYEEGYKKKEKGHEHTIDKSELKREFAQVLMLFLQLANHYDIDLNKTFSDELKIMEKRFKK